MNRTLSLSSRSRRQPLRAFALTGLLLLCFAVLAARPVLARPDYVSVVKKTYALKAGGAIEKAGCNLCHAGGPPKVNLFGQTVKEALEAAKTKTLTPALLQSVEAKDADGDRVNSKAEFLADTLPGDPASKPEGEALIAATAAASKTTAPAPESGGPFSPKTLLFPSHAQHPVLVHFPVALIFISLFFDLLGKRTRNTALLTASYYNLLVAAATSPLAVITGLMAWQFARGGEALTGFLLYHLILGIMSMLLLCTLAGIRSQQRRKGQNDVSNGFLALMVLTAAIIAIAGHLGGTLVYGG